MSIPLMTLAAIVAAASMQGAGPSRGPGMLLLGVVSSPQKDLKRCGLSYPGTAQGCGGLGSPLLRLVLGPSAWQLEPSQVVLGTRA